MMKRFLLVFCLLLVVCLGTYTCVDGKTYIYKETTGNNSMTTNLTQDDGLNDITISFSNNNETHQLVCSKDYATKTWKYSNTTQGTAIEAERAGDIIKLKGTLNKKEIQNNIKIDQAPWFEFIEVSLVNFLKSNDQTTAFWMIQPNNLKTYKMIAKKKNTEVITVNDQKIEAMKVTVTLQGFLSMFWSVNYWFRISDHTFVRYEGVRGGPGTPKTITQLLNETN